MTAPTSGRARPAGRMAALLLLASLAGGCSIFRGSDPLDARNVMHPDADVRRETVEALGRRRVPETVPVLTDRLLKDPDPLVRAQAARSLGQLGYREAVVYLVEGLKDTHAVVRWDACTALGAMREPASLDAVVPLLRSDESTNVKRAAAQTLAKIGGDRAVPPLIAATADPEAGVAKAAAVALLELTGQSFGARREAWEAWWAAQPRSRREPEPPAADPPASNPPAAGTAS